MHEVFINFRTGDEGSAAALIERDLSTRFGDKRVFRDSKSIPAGDDFNTALLDAVRNSQVMLACIGPRWLTSELDNENDWIRRELLEAREYGVRVIPVLVGDHLPQLEKARLPAALSWLADCQFRRFSTRNVEADLHRLATDLMELVPSLAATAKRAPVDDTRPHNMTVVNGNHGNINSGSGSQYIGIRRDER